MINAVIIVGITVVLTAIPLLIFWKRKPSWASDVARELGTESSESEAATEPSPEPAASTVL